MRPIPIPQRSSEPPPVRGKADESQPSPRLTKKFVGMPTVVGILSALVVGLLFWTARQSAINAKHVPRKTTAPQTNNLASLFDGPVAETRRTNALPHIPEEEFLPSSEMTLPSPIDSPQPPSDQPTTNQPKPNQPTAVKNPFAGFATRIPLPEVIPNRATQLGPVNLPPGFVCFTYLRGGETASRERHALSLESAAGSEHEWEIVARLFQEETPRKIARLAIRDQGFWLTWAADAAENPATGALANCNFRLTTGLGTHDFMLRELQVIDPLPVQFAKLTYDWELPHPPQSENIRVEIQIQSPPTVGPRRFLGSATIPASNGVTGVEFGTTPGQRGLKLKFESKLDGDGIHFTVSPWVQLTGQFEPLALTSANCVRLRDSLATIIGATQKKMAGANPTARSGYQQKIAAIQQAQGELKRLDSLKPVFETECRITVKVTYLTNDSVAELISTR